MKIFNFIGHLLTLIAFAVVTSFVYAATEEIPRSIDYPPYPAAPVAQSEQQADAKSAGCVSCHTQSDRKTMHHSQVVVLGCTDCHGGQAEINKPDNIDKSSDVYLSLLDKAHVQARYPERWHYPSSANPKQSYTLLNQESPEYIRFINPSDLRVARESCGACHMKIIEATERSLMSSTAMLWQGASYNNGILPFKRGILGEHYNREGTGATVKAPESINNHQNNEDKHLILPVLYPLPAWETVPSVDPFRVFERGGRNIVNLFAETGLPNVIGQIQRLEEPGKPDIRQSNRGPGTGARISVPVLNITKTRLNDPNLWFIGTNDQPGDYRHSGCAACHVIYANDRDVKHSAQYAQYGNEGKTITVDPTISKEQSGHPLKHEFTRAIPSSQCMICHMHQPNMFMNTYLGYTMWDYEADAPFMWPEKQLYPDDKTVRAVLDRNPEGAAVRGKWADVDFLKKVSELNPQLKDTQFADYHGHGWNFRAVFKRDRQGYLLDDNGEKVNDSDPRKFKKAVHLSSVHLDKGMHCVDCHYTNDVHGNGHIYGEVAAAVEISCKDCHGTVNAYPALITSGPAASKKGLALESLRNPDGRKRFEWTGNKLIQRSVLKPELEWEISLVKDSVNPAHKNFNAKAARAKTMSRSTTKFNWGPGVSKTDYAHNDDEMTCYSCHSSWTTSCGGCHLPIEANWKTERKHYEGGASRNFATYNPQVARDQMFQLGKHGIAKDFKIAPVRSSSALVLSSTNANREHIYTQQAPISASGFSSQAFAPHFPHTVRKTETKTCTDCHVSDKNDNNAIMTQLLLLGTQFVNFVGLNAWLGTEDNIVAARVTEWDEPQAVIGSYLQRYAYPDNFKQHQAQQQKLEEAYQHSSGIAHCLQLRGEYLYVAEGKKGMRVYDVANIANKGFSQRIVSAPFSPWGQKAFIKSKNASCVVLPTTQPIHPDRNKGELMRDVNLEQPMHPVYNYAVITDLQEGIILTDVNTLADAEPRNNFLKRALTWNPNRLLDGARHVTIGGYYFYVVTGKQLVIADFNEPLHPKVIKTIALEDPRYSALQFRYLYVTTAKGLQVIDVSLPEKAILLETAITFKNARRVYLARTYAYVAAGEQGLGIVDITIADKPVLQQLFNADGQLNDAQDVIIATTNASLFAYLADGKNGLKVLQLTSPELQPRFYGFSPEPNPQLIAYYPTNTPALSLSKGLDRDRAVDETGGQIAVFGRLGSRPFNLEEMRRLFMQENGKVWTVSDEIDFQDMQK